MTLGVKRLLQIPKVVLERNLFRRGVCIRVDLDGKAFACIYQMCLVTRAARVMLKSYTTPLAQYCLWL